MVAANLIYKGSVKDLYRSDKGLSFVYSDRYSIFDWGEMPDQLDGKGTALAIIAKTLFSELEEMGVLHHGLDLQSLNGNAMHVKEVQVLRPLLTEGNGQLKWDYSAYQDAAKIVDALVPLEVIFRFGVPKGSSLIERASNAAYLQEIGLSAAPKVGDVFDIPVIEFSTKLETTDRYISYQEAQKIAGLSSEEMSRLLDLTKKVATRLKLIFGDIGLDLWDGKFEFAFSAPKIGESARNFVLVDSIGPDELRLIFNDLQFSKEFLRQIYAQSSWLKAVKSAKELASARGLSDWKSIVMSELNEKPAHLTAEQKSVGELIYKAIANALLQRRGHSPFFSEGSEKMEDVYQRMKSLN